MSKKISKIIIALVCVISISCSTSKKVADDDFGVDDSQDQNSATSNESGDLNLDDTGSATSSAKTEDAQPLSTDDAKDEFAEFDQATDPAPENPPIEQPSPITQESSVVQTDPPSGQLPVNPEPPPPAIVENTQPSLPEPPVPPPAVVEQAPVLAPPPISPSTTAEITPLNTESSSSGRLSRIKNLKFLANDNGGTIVITADRPIQFRTRTNSKTNQMVIEVLDAVMPENLKRALNTRDMITSIGSVDIYQNSTSNVARFVIQLRQGASTPLVQPEGNSLLVVSSPSIGSWSASSYEAEGVRQNSGIMSSDSIEDFLANNNKFFGKKMSLETTDMDVRDILRFISEEAGINMIFDDNISGKMSLKLRQVPWDQALVTVLKAKKLGYRRQGQVLRVGQISTLTAEEDEAIKLKEAKQKVEPLVVKNFQINYAEVSELEAKIKDFIKDGDAAANTSRGKVTTDARTNTLIVTDTALKLNQVEKLVSLLDTQPQQVLIEARVIEASEDYSRAIGVNFGFNLGPGAPANLLIDGAPRYVTKVRNQDPLNISPAIGSTPTTNGLFNASLWLGKFGSFGDLSTVLSLDEKEGKIKILSSPRVSVLHNKKATIKQASIIRVPDTTTVTTAGTPTTTTKEVEVGVILDVTPKISNIGTVNLDLKIEKSAPTTGGNRTTRDVTTNVIIKSGDTAVIGGVFTSDATTSFDGVPGLKDIPILGTLFSSKSVSKSKTELMFFISPKILKSLDIPVISTNSDGQESETQTK